MPHARPDRAGPVYIGPADQCPCGAGALGASGLCPAGHGRFPDDVTGDPDGRLTGYPARRTGVRR